MESMLLQTMGNDWNKISSTNKTLKRTVNGLEKKGLIEVLRFKEVWEFKKISWKYKVA